MHFSLIVKPQSRSGGAAQDGLNKTNGGKRRQGGGLDGILAIKKKTKETAS